MVGRFLLIVAYLLPMHAGNAGGAGQNGGDAIPPGSIIVAAEKLGDPNFAESVVLITRREDDGATMGVVLNRPSDISLAKAFPHLHGADDPVFQGGPVDSDAVQALIRSKEKPDEAAQRVVADVYSVTHKAVLEKSINDKLPSSKFRVYLGYAGWGPGQLEAELRAGAWAVLQAPQYIFDGHPATLWDRLDREVHSQLAMSAAHATMKACRRLSAPRFSLLSSPPPSPRNPLPYSFFAFKTTPLIRN